MQLTGSSTLDAAVDAALAADVREISIQFFADWSRNGLFNHAWSDMSELVQNMTIDAEIQGSLPSDVTVTTGYVTAEMVVTLGGNRSENEMFFHQVMSEYNAASPLYGVDRQSTPIYFNYVINTTLGPVTVRKFTGILYGVQVNRRAETVVFTCRDATATLTQNITAPKIAVDGWSRQQHSTLTTAAQFSPTVLAPTLTTLPMNSAGVIDYLLRANGRFQGPQPHPSSVLSVPLTGTMLPDALVGGHFDWNIGNDSGLGNPIDAICRQPKEAPPWAPGKYGIALTPLVGEASYTMYYDCYQLANPNSPTASGYTVGMGFWVHFTPGAFTWSNYPDATVIYLGGYPDPTFPFITDVASLTLGVNPDGTIVGALLGNGYTWNFSSTVNLTTDAWHYVGLAVTFGVSAVSYVFNVDGTLQTTQTSAGAFPNHNPWNQTPAGTNFAEVQAEHPMQYAQIWAFVGTAAGMFWPKDPPAGANPSISMGMNTLSFLPDLIQLDTWSTIQQIVAAEFGVIYADELGSIKSLSRIAFRATATPAVQVITTDALLDLPMSSVYDGIRNSFSWATTSAAMWEQPVWTSPTLEYLDLPSGGFLSIPIKNPDAAMIYSGVQGLTGPSPDSSISTIIQGWWASELDNAGVQFNPTSGPFVDSGYNNLFWAVFVNPDGRNAILQINNQSGHDLRFATTPATGNGVPAWIIDGFQQIKDDQVTGTVTETSSVLKYGTQLYTLPASDWVQDPASAIAICNALALETYRPVPICGDIPVIGDPRRQLNDYVDLRDPGQSGTRMPAVITGIRNEWSKTNGCFDTLKVQMQGPPQSWILGDADFSILGSTTNLI